jgi:hypothetical protein
MALCNATVKMQNANDALLRTNWVAGVGCSLIARHSNQFAFCILHFELQRT